MTEKTEQPTPKKERDAREEGQVAHSKDFSQAVLVLITLLWLIFGGEGMAEHMGQALMAPADLLNLPFTIALDAMMKRMVSELVWLMLPFVLIPIVFGLIVEVAQVGVTLSGKALIPTGKHLNPVENAKNIFSKKSLFELFKTVLKITVLASIVWLLLWHNLPSLVWLPSSNIATCAAVFSGLLEKLTLYMAPVYGTLAAADVIWQKRQHRKELMMSHDEVQREFKEMEGDPHIKQKRKDLHKELANNKDVQRSASASALVVNPTHVAVALYYDEARTALPIVWAKGADGLARQMIQAAKANKVPVLRNIDLAWKLWEHGEKNQYIPSELIGPVADIIRVVNDMKNEGQL
ncbi:type III secretion system export apparatus subunit SctU [Paraburkholderia bonniea]|uniref:type III secretion system export apparatus subunit SctU n=1 Tax=Paraburkholderia bonniea TaxID=2152891 RepID=UPI00129247A7|nr:type III secretion system export apparatus subunit SctU [Paraburkholderia bonniea]WJF89304.1 type III secretion system export apparatus subunit SctU [Paraburkholderia bonniea]WJF92620.1 type III secretion system export apparatus subunit SctU [Paraburkholderia bonniea]